MVEAVVELDGQRDEIAPFRHFDSEIERAYLAERRTDQRGRARLLLWFGYGNFAVYAIDYNLIMRGAVLSLHNLNLLVFALTLALYTRVVFSGYYLRVRWIDAPFLLVFVAWQAVTTLVLFGGTETTDIPDALRFAHNALMWVFLSSVLIVGTFFWFAVVAALVVFTVIAVYLVSPAVEQVAPVAMFPFLMATTLAAFLNYIVEDRARAAFIAQQALARKQRQAEALLHNMVPASVVPRLHAGGEIVDAHDEVSIIFIDIVGFSKLSKLLSPFHLVDLLNRLFGMMDQCAQAARVEKVKTIGDAYLAVAGSTIPVENSAIAAVDFALKVRAGLAEHNAGAAMPVTLRIGVNTGFVIGGVVGSLRTAYDYWGEAMNLAARIEATGAPGAITIAESTRSRCGDRFDFTECREVMLKGVGPARVCTL